jgi:hypothetical protein
MIFSLLIQSLFRSDGIGTGLWIFDLTRFLDANRSPLRWRTLQMNFVPAAANVTRPHQQRHGLRRVHDWNFEAEAAKVSDPAENSFL